MEDAYEIGIRLVLENGVSAGIAALQHDLATYDRALAATTGRQRTVTEVGRQLAAPAGSGGGGPAVQAPAIGERSQAPDAVNGHQPAPPVPSPAMPLPVARPPQVTAVAARVEPPQPAAGAAPALPRPAAGVAPALPRPAAGAAPALPRPAAGAGSALVRPSTGAAPALPRPVAAGPACAPADRALRPAAIPAQPGRSAAAPQEGGAATGVAVRMAVPPPSYARYAPASPSGLPAAVPAPGGAEGPPVAMPAPDRGARAQQASIAVRDVVRPAGVDAPLPGAAPNSAGPLPTPRPSAAAALPAAPTAAASSSGPAQGDVYLDGARVGRWMSNRMAREAERPQAGVTGFDPRLSPAWPGSLHGT